MKTLKKKKDGRLFLGGYLTVKECPKCGSNLYHEVAGELTLYSCNKCGYIGPVALEPLKSKKKDKKKFDDAVKTLKKMTSDSKPKRK